jgi:hypothetical protein
MGLFNVFKGSKTFPRTDMVYQTYETKAKGCVDFLKNNKIDICVAWFENTYKQYSQLFDSKPGLNTKISMANTLFPFSLDNKNILFLEHYPLFSKEDNLLGKSKANKVWFINSLEDPIMKIFGVNISKMMEALGLGKDEFIEHKLVAKSIVNAQKKLEKGIWTDFHAKSGDDWIMQFQTNKKKAF